MTCGTGDPQQGKVAPPSPQKQFSGAEDSLGLGYQPEGARTASPTETNAFLPAYHRTIREPRSPTNRRACPALSHGKTRCPSQPRAGQ